jgi:CubicO group peptidase (beta-lactamase class C family)
MHFPGPRKVGRPLSTRRAFLGGLAALAGVSAVRGAEADTLGDIVASFDRERKDRRIPSISVALVEGGHISLCQRGMRSVSGGQSVGPETRYQAASISKTFAAVTALCLSIQRRVSLDEDVSNYLKRWRLPALPPGSTRKVTLRRLFGMTSGCNVPGYAGYASGAPLPDDVGILQGGAPANSPPVIFVTPPGAARAYSGGGCQVGQVVLEDATAQSFRALVEQTILGPLAMSHSAFWQPPDASQLGSLAIAHDRDGKEIDGGWHVYPEFAAAGLWSTPSDIAQLIVAMAGAAGGNTGTVFAERGLSDMLTSVDNLGYGLGVALAGSERDHVSMKRGNNVGFRSAFVACPARAQGAVVMTNGDNGESVVDGVLDALARHYRWPARSPWPE